MDAEVGVTWKVTLGVSSSHLCTSDVSWELPSASTAATSMVTYGTNLGVATAQDEHCPDCAYGRIAESDGSRAREPRPSVPRGNETIHRCAGPVPR